jgi:hypothetical protein
MAMPDPMVPAPRIPSDSMVMSRPSQCKKPGW